MKLQSTNEMIKDLKLEMARVYAELLESGYYDDFIEAIEGMDVEEFIEETAENNKLTHLAEMIEIISETY